MAKLQSGDLSFQFEFTGFEHDWVQYQFYFRWNGDHIIRDELLKRSSSYWEGRSVGAFLANEYKSDGLIPPLKKVLNEDEADYWEPMEPDIIIAIYPDQFFPFMKSHMRLVYESDEHKERRQAREELKRAKQKLPDDLFTFIAFLDAYNLKNADAYYGEGISLQLCVRRSE